MLYASSSVCQVVLGIIQLTVEIGDARTQIEKLILRSCFLLLMKDAWKQYLLCHLMCEKNVASMPVVKTRSQLNSIKSLANKTITGKLKMISVAYLH